MCHYKTTEHHHAYVTTRPQSTTYHQSTPSRRACTTGWQGPHLCGGRQGPELCGGREPRSTHRETHLLQRAYISRQTCYKQHTSRDTSGAHYSRHLRSTHLETPPTRSTLVQTPPAPNHHASSHTSQNNLKIRFLTVLIVCWRPPPSDASSVCVCVFLLGVGVVWEECGWV